MNRVAERLFDKADLPDALSLIERDCTPELCHTTGTPDFERVRLAALKLSDGSLDKLTDAVALAQTDFRDLLMAAGFGRLDAHVRWMDTMLAVRPE